MIPCDFRVKVRGPVFERTALAGLLRKLPCKPVSDENSEIVVSLETILPSQSHERQCYFWAEPGFLDEREHELWITGSMRDAPPLGLIMSLAQRFPSLTFDCVSETNGELLEHWRAGPQRADCELIESWFLKPQTDGRRDSFLKEGEVSVFNQAG